MDDRLRERLAAVCRNRTLPAGRPEAGRNASPPPRPPAGRIPLLEKILPGTEHRGDCGVCWRHERPLSRWAGAAPGLTSRLAGALAASPPADLEADPALELWRRRGPEAAVFLDIETTGLSATPVFLAGILGWDEGEMSFRLYLARDYSEEAAVVDSIRAELVRHPVAVTYNGKSYDLPFLGERAGRLRVRPVGPAGVLDLLHPARRRWAGRFPDCRLSTLESRLFGRNRSGDIPGRDIPPAYHRFVRNHDPGPLMRVFQHNMADLHALAEVTGKILLSPPREPQP